MTTSIGKSRSLAIEIFLFMKAKTACTIETRLKKIRFAKARFFSLSCPIIY